MNAIFTTRCHAGEGFGMGRTGNIRGSGSTASNGQRRSGHGQPGTRSGPKQLIGCEDLQFGDDIHVEGCMLLACCMHQSTRKSWVGIG